MTDVPSDAAARGAPAATADDVSQLLVEPKSVRDRAAAEEAEKPAAPQVARPEELILVAEDSKTNAAIISLNIRNLGFDVLEFKDGRQAIDEVGKMDEKQLGRVKAVFSDYMMPNADGVEFLTFIRQHPKLGKIPFYICSALAEKSAIQRAMALSCTGYILKPVTFDKLRKSIVTCFPGREFPTQEEIAARKASERK